MKRHQRALANPAGLRALLGVGLLLACPRLVPLSAAEETFTPHHVAKLRAVSAAEVSPDGKHVAYLLYVPRDLNKDKDGRAWSELHVVDTSGKSRPYVAGQVNVSAAAWTPDGKSISFLAKRGDDKHRALYVLPLDGGEARKVHGHDTDISGYSWSPDGKQVAFLATEPKPKEKKELEEKGFNQEIFEEDWKPVKVWVATVDGEDAPKPKALDLPGSASELHWSPKAPLLAVALAPTPSIDDHLMHREVHVVNAQTGEVVVNLANPGKLGEVAWSPDGKHIAIVSAQDEHDPREGRLWVIEPKKGAKWRVLIGADYKGHVESIAWRDPRTLLYVASEGVESVVGEVKLDGGGKKTIVPRGGPILSAVTVSEDGKAAAFVGESPRHPQEVYFLGPGDEKPRRLTTSNPWLKEMKFAPQEVVTWKARDGLELQGILVRPLGAEPDQSYPLVLTVHGGPEAHVPNGWVTAYHSLGQVGAANGFAVFYPNYRGSTGRGVEFSKMGQEDAAGKEFDDLIDAVDHLIKTGLVDKDKVGVTGGSYGGFATAWCSTRYSDRFAAGVMFVGISDNISKVGTTDIPDEMYLVHHRKWLWQDWDYFLKRSPIYHIEKAHTPLLILHGKNDTRVHPGQSLELYRHLKVRNKAPVRLVLYPGEGHGNRRAASRLDYSLRLSRWMEHFLKEGGKKAPPYELDYGLKKKEEEKAEGQ